MCVCVCVCMCVYMCACVFICYLVLSVIWYYITTKYINDILMYVCVCVFTCEHIFLCVRYHINIINIIILYCGYIIWCSYFNGHWVHIKHNGRHVFSISENAITKISDMADDIIMEATGAATDIKIRQGYFDPITVTMELDDGGSSITTYPSQAELNKVLL